MVEPCNFRVSGQMRWEKVKFAKSESSESIFFLPHSGWDLSSVGDIECIGITYGIVGEIKFPGVYDPHLLIIKEASAIGCFDQNRESLTSLIPYRVVFTLHFPFRLSLQDQKRLHFKPRWARCSSFSLLQAFHCFLRSAELFQPK